MAQAARHALKAPKPAGNAPRPAGDIVRDAALTWRQVAAVAEGAPLSLSAAAADRVRAARDLVDAIVERGIRAYGVNTGSARCAT